MNFHVGQSVYIHSSRRHATVTALDEVNGYVQVKVLTRRRWVAPSDLEDAKARARAFEDLKRRS